VPSETLSSFNGALDAAQCRHAALVMSCLVDPQGCRCSRGRQHVVHVFYIQGMTSRQFVNSAVLTLVSLYSSHSLLRIVSAIIIYRKFRSFSIEVTRASSVCFFLSNSLTSSSTRLRSSSVKTSATSSPANFSSAKSSDLFNRVSCSACSAARAS
jgi:hypothetical protein